MSKRPEQTPANRAGQGRADQTPRPAPRAASTFDDSTEARGFNANWFLSRTVRHATHMRKHVWKILCAQRDLLSPQAIDAVSGAVRRMKSACHATREKKAIEAEMTHLETVANKWLKPYPHAGFRENVEVLLVAIAVAMAIRTFFAQPFKIPTGSMQPTLYGVTSVPDYSKGFLRAQESDFEIPNRLMRYVHFWWSGVAYDHVVARAPGQMKPAGPLKKFLLFNLKQTFYVGTEAYTVWFPPDKLLQRAGLVDAAGYPTTDRVFQPDDTLIKLKSFSGDHLFVDRLTYNFRRPKRGEIVVFETKDIAGMLADRQLADQVGQFYIKRLVGLGGETLRIGDDRHLVVNGKPLDSSTPHFEKIYSFDPAKPPAPSTYSGHVNSRGYPGLAPLFADEQMEFQVPTNHFVVMGDNTLDSSDSRRWGSFPQQNVIGKNWFVYWPFGRQDGRESRWGWNR